MDGKALTIHLQAWDDREKVAAKEQVKTLLEHPGWEYLSEGIELYVSSLLKSHISSPQESIEKYAHTTGHMKGLREIESIAKGIVEAGEKAEKELRAAERVEA